MGLWGISRSKHSSKRDTADADSEAVDADDDPDDASAAAGAGPAGAPSHVSWNLPEEVVASVFSSVVVVDDVRLTRSPTISFSSTVSLPITLFSFSTS